MLAYNAGEIRGIIMHTLESKKTESKAPCHVALLAVFLLSSVCMAL